SIFLFSQPGQPNDRSGMRENPLGCRARPWTGLRWLQLVVFGLLVPLAFAWESGDLELFDLVEEVPQNFYAFLGVEQVKREARLDYSCISVLTLSYDHN
uniref:Uncharacterized protein n=1 Tax=Laticauda laticaudata TaxID=8630 RepID=A0A8C5WRG6_LATLA